MSKRIDNSTTKKAFPKVKSCLWEALNLLRNRAIIVILMVFTAAMASAQDVLVSVEQKTSVFPSMVSSYIDNPYTYFRIRLQNMTNQTQRVYLTMEIACQYSASGEAFRIATDDGRRTVRPLIELAPNQSYVIDNRDRYDSQFAGRMTTNMSNNTVSSMTNLPEGNYNLCVSACRWSQSVSSDNVINNNCISFMVCYTGSAPELITPLGGMTETSVGEAIPEMEPARNLNFRWTGVITNCLKMARFEYVIKIVKVLPGQNYQDAINRNSVVFSKECGSKTFCTLDTLRDLNVTFERGATYAVQVSATQRGNANLQIGNNGKSIVKCFKWGHKDNNSDTYVPGYSNNDEEEDTTAHPPVVIPSWNMDIKKSVTKSNNRGEVLDKILPPCIVTPERDRLMADVLTERQKGEDKFFPEINKSFVTSYLSDGTPVVDKQAEGFEFQWMRVRSFDIHSADYIVKLYEYVGDPTVTLRRTPLKTKTIEGFERDSYDRTDHTTVFFKDTAFLNAIKMGKQYMMTVTAQVSFYYKEASITTTTYSETGKPDSITVDTTYTTKSDVVEYTTKLVFQYGIDKGTLDKLTPPQFTYPVNMSTASWDDTTHLEFGESIPEIPRYHNFSFDWKKADGADVDDTLLYDLYIYNCKQGDTLSKITKGKAKWVYKGITDLTLTDSIADSLKTGSKYVARLCVRTAPDSLKYNLLGNGWSLPIAFKLVDTTAFDGIFDLTNACFPGDTAGLSRQVIQPNIDSLINNRVRLKMGKFDMIVQKGTLKDGKYSGEGFVVWRPTKWGANIKVRFDTVVVNKDYHIIAGTARSIPTDSNNYLKLNLGNNKFAAGFDMGSDKVNENMDFIASKIGNEDTVKMWYDRIMTTSNVLTEIIHSGYENELSMGTATAPLRIDNKMFNIEDNNFAVAVNDFFFSPVTAQINLLAVFGAPRDNVYIPALATNICIVPNALFADSVSTVKLFSPRDYEFELSDGYTMRFKKPSNFADVKDGCFISINKKGPTFTIDVDLDFGKKGQDGNKLLAVDMKNNGIVNPSKPVMAHFTTTISSWDDWVVKIAMDPFTVVGCEDYTFIPTGRCIIFDHSKKSTPKEVRFPANYIKKDQQNQWQGLYIDYFGILMPEEVSNTFVDLNGEADDTPDSTVIYRVGANGEKTDTIDYVYPGHRINFTASQLVWDKDGLSVMVSVNDILKADTRNGGGWYFSLDTVGLKIEKSKFKYGRICGKVRVPLFTGKLDYACQLSSDSIVFNVTPTDSLTLNLFLAKVKLDNKSSYLKIFHNFGGETNIVEKDKITGTKYYMLDDKSHTRVDLTLNGKLDIDLEKIGVDASIPAIKFENMYLRNFRSEKHAPPSLKPGKNKVTYYSFGKLDYSIGNWSKASPQKYIGTAPSKKNEALVDGLVDYQFDDDKKPKKNGGKGGEPEGETTPIDTIQGTVYGFAYSITGFNGFIEHDENNSDIYKAGIDFGGTMKLKISDSMSFGANAGFSIWCKVNVKEWTVDSVDGELDSVRFLADIGPLHAEAAIFHTNNDPVFGNSWRGMARVTVMGVIDCGMGCGFGTNPKPDGNGNYDWWYFEGACEAEHSPMVIGPVTIKGFGGGFAYNCVPSTSFAGASARNMMSKSFVDAMVSNSGSNYKPQYDAWMAKAGISLALSASPATLNAFGTLNLRIANGHFSGICLQVQANMMTNYDEKNDSASNYVLGVNAFIDYTNRGKDDWSLTFSAFAKADLNMASLLKGAAGDIIPAKITLPGGSFDDIKGLAPSSLSKYVEPMVDATNKDADVEGKQAGFFDHNFGGSASLQIPIDLFIDKHPGKETQWYFSVGRPAYDDRVIFSAEYDLVVCKSSTKWTFYFMTGNHFPDEFSLPAIPDDVADFLGEKYKARAEKGRYLPTFKDGGGFAFGASFEAHIKYSMILFVEGSAYVGFDAALINTKGQGCEGYSKIGKNNFYGMGQAYLMLQGKAGLELNLLFWKGQLNLVEAGIGAVIQAGGPNPTWAFGMLRFKCTCLGGKIKINTAVDFELGHTCVPGASDPLANVKLFQNVTPGYTEKNYTDPKNVASPYTTGVIVSNLPWNQDVLLTAMDDKAQTVTRKFRFVLDEQMSFYRYKHLIGGKKKYKNDKDNYEWRTGRISVTPSSTDENTLYFETESGGFREQTEQMFHFYGRVFEYRTTINNNLKQYYVDRDTVYYVYNNRCSVKWKPNSGHDNYYGWRKPLYTDNGVTTFVTNKQYYQDTVVYLKTETAPEDLYNCVVYTWPYNGDPSVPIDEIYHVSGHYKVPIYIYSHREFLKPDQVDNSGRQIKAFLVTSGWGEKAEAEACDYEYYEKGFQGSKMPCIVVTLPRDFSPQNYNDRSLAVRLLMVREKEYQAQLDAMNQKANELMTNTKFEKQSRSNLGELYKDYLGTILGAAQSGNTGYTVVQDSNAARGASTGEGSTSTQFNVRLAQLKATAEEYLQGEADTAMGFNRKSLASGYVAAVRAGKPVYNLYFRLCNGYETYSDVLDEMDINWLFSPANSNNQFKHDGSESVTHTVSKKTPSTHKELVTARMAYLFDEYEPDDKSLYRQGTRLPPIMNACMDVNDNREDNFNSFHYYNNNFLQLYRVYAKNAAEMNDAIKITSAHKQRPGQNCKDKDHWYSIDKYPVFCYDKDKKNWGDFATSDEIARIKQVASMGLIKQQGLNFENVNAGIRVAYYKGAAVPYQLREAYESQIPVVKDSAFGINGAPIRLMWKNLDTKGRIDSLVLAGQKKTYKMTDSRTQDKPQYTYTASFEITDKILYTMMEDIKAYYNFYQQLYEYGLFMESKNYDKKVSEFKYFYKQSHCYNLLSFSNTPLTMPKSILATWWMNAFYAIANYEEKVMNNWVLSKPPSGARTISYDDLKQYGFNSSVCWGKYVAHYSKHSIWIERRKGMYDGYLDADWFALHYVRNRQKEHNGFIIEPEDGSKWLAYKLKVFYGRYGTQNNLLGNTANMVKEASDNPDAHPFIATNYRLNNDWLFKFNSYDKYGSELHKVYRIIQRKSTDKLDNDWFENE